AVDHYWAPKEYILPTMLVDTPEYSIKDGSVVKETWEIAENNTISILCERISQDKLKIPPYWPNCTVLINQRRVTDLLRTDVLCESYTQATNCKQTVQLIIYKDANLDSEYLMCSTVVGGSFDSIYMYRL